MQPALSIIFFTSASGAGFGLFVFLSAYTLFYRPDSTLFATACGVALLLIVLGLFSSTLHLANPKNAWRAFSRFKTSWLAREAVLAVAFFPVVVLWAIGGWFNIAEQSYLLWVFGSLVTLALALATVFSTAMIYACLKTIPQWHTAMTPTNYIFLSLASGGLLLLSLFEIVGLMIPSTVLISSLLFVIVAALAKLIYYAWIGTPKGSTIATATGLSNAPVRLLDVGHTAGTFLTDEFGYTLAKNRCQLLRAAVFVFAFIVPALLIISVMAQTVTIVPLATLAFASAFLGVLIERWLFFAEARHVVNLYHGTQKV